MILRNNTFEEFVNNEIDRFKPKNYFRAELAAQHRPKVSRYKHNMMQVEQTYI